MSKVIIDINRCDFCGACVAVCSEDAIELRESDIAIDTKKCILCGECRDVCPIGAVEIL